MNINWKKAIGFGVLLWVLMFVIVSIFVAFKIVDLTGMNIVIAIIAGLISLILAGYVKPDKASTALSYGLSWVVIGIILDAVVTLRFNPAIFTDWSLWLGYVLVLLAPVSKVKKAGQSSAPEVS
jgi:hypothetical protein